MIYFIILLVFILISKIYFKYQKKERFSNNKNLIFIHIGKTGGGTIQKILKKKNINHIIYHLENYYTYDKNNKYLISIRNPISRFISGWNWRKYTVCPRKVGGCPNKKEKIIYKKYSLNDFLENLFEKKIIDKNTRMRHIIPTNISYYLKTNNFLDDYDSNVKNINIITCENLYEDLENSLGKKINKLKLDVHISKKEDKYEDLSSLGKINLLKFLKDDYDCIEKLNDLNLLTKEQYDVLSKKIF